MDIKKLVTIALLLSTSAISFSQIKLTKRAEQQQEISFDYSKNWQGKEYRNYIGQSLYVVPKNEKLVKYGYEGFYEKPNGDVFQQISNTIRNTKSEALVNKTFKVENVIVAGEDFLGAPNIYLILTLDADTLYYKYDLQFEHKFPFIVMGYFDKLKADNIGKKSCLIRLNTKYTDYITGKEVKVTPGTIWTCSDIVFDTEFGSLKMLFTNSEGETISNEAYRYKYMFISEAYKHQLETKYGKALIQKAINGDIQKGMSTELVKVALGEPESINYANYGDQWVYKGIYVYIKNGKVTGWN